jgi:hypothetical protein
MNTLSSIFVTELAYDQDLLKQTVQGKLVAKMIIETIQWQICQVSVDTYSEGQRASPRTSECFDNSRYLETRFSKTTTSTGLTPESTRHETY